jgi:hypothetical protein
MEPDTIEFESKFWIERRMREADQWRLQSTVRESQRGSENGWADTFLASLRTGAIGIQRAIQTWYVGPEPQCC